MTNKPNIPDSTSDLTNDSGFITSSYHDSTKQDVLTAGDNIDIANNEISLADPITLTSEPEQSTGAYAQIELSSDNSLTASHYDGKNSDPELIAHYDWNGPYVERYTFESGELVNTEAVYMDADGLHFSSEAYAYDVTLAYDSTNGLTLDGEPIGGGTTYTAGAGIDITNDVISTTQAPLVYSYDATTNTLTISPSSDSEV